MDIERLKELRGEVSNVAFIALSKLVDKNARANVVKFGEDLQELIDETIARQSVKSEDVQEAITVLKRINHTREQVARMVLIEWAQPQKAIQQTVDLAIAALQAYEPWIPKK